MFGPYEDLARVLAKERVQAACCAGVPRAWCAAECRAVSRHG